MSHSTHVGFNEPPICSESGRLFFAIVSADAFPDRQSRAVGVANVRADTASTKFPPSRALRGVTRPPWLPSVDRGVGQSFTADDRPQPAFSLAPGWLCSP